MAAWLGTIDGCTLTASDYGATTEIASTADVATVAASLSATAGASLFSSIILARAWAFEALDLID